MHHCARAICIIILHKFIMARSDFGNLVETRPPMAVKGSKFNMSAVAKDSLRGKRAAESSLGRSSKMPKATDCTFVEQGPKPQRVAQRLPSRAPVLLCIYKVTNEAADVWNLYEKKEGVMLWQVQMQHEARPSITFGIVDEFNIFLRKAHAKEDAIPASLVDLQERAGIKLVLTDRSDPDEVGFVQWRIAFYVAGPETALNNFLFLLDDFFVMRCNAMARERPFEVHLHPHVGVNISDSWDDLTYEHYTLHDTAQTLALGIFEAQPVAGKRIVVVHIQPESGELLSILVVGNTWNFRSRMDSHGVAGAYFSGNGSEENRKYVRILKSIDVSETAQQQRVLGMFGDRVFKHLAIRVVVDSALEEGTDVAAIVERLRNMPSLHFSIDHVVVDKAASSTLAS